MITSVGGGSRRRGVWLVELAENGARTHVLFKPKTCVCQECQWGQRVRGKRVHVQCQ